ncbi:ABC transporter permease [Roseivirga pacifica]|uniref:ABC transporter permease n=2 Tax=Roseivirga pacifica TaxID=1267423 RepID=UPI00209420B0|nr:ABC transporter permease [Roseivirga pacifica]MCO6357554.1 FtsX-like permease family protein [Roseivirga pacifica]MCO6365807.1 FtsX-like permease family protein [Roseivirga pacifica]MCO6371136.1 FtsX-like permease family protein [Roseivirga pacifica]MCO6375693.1 FtsX-like permease family protein [Roseivirga pacifica]MCO6378514.1 FtsX-like permease family protein [Roseivirga pacifica]
MHYIKSKLKINSMFFNHFKFAFRQLNKQKAFSLINVVGLALSMVACLLIFKYVSFEKSYDAHIKEADQVFRIYRIAEGEDPLDGVASVFPGMTPIIQQNIPEVDKIARVIGSSKIFQSFAFTYYAPSGSNKTFNIPNGYFADGDAINIFSMDWVEGEGVASLKHPFEMVISNSFKERFFGEEPAVGKMLRFKNYGRDIKVTGVFDDLPENTHFKYDLLVSFKSLPAEWNLDSTFGWGNFYTYIKTTPEASVLGIEDKINNAFVNTDGAWFKEEGITFKLQQVRDIHLNSHHAFEFEANGNQATVKFLTIIGVFIMIVAWVNYINLSTSKLVDRAKEVGIRKVLGGYKKQLVAQFLVEGFLINLLAIIVALTLLQATKPWFEALLGIPIELFNASNIQLTLVLLASFALGALLFGFYPAVLFSGQKVSSVLKGRSRASKSGLLLRKSLTVFQYVVAVVLILGTLAVKQQMGFIQNQSPGMNIDQTLVVKKPFIEADKRSTAKPAFLNQVNQLSNVAAIAASSEIPGYEISRMRWIALGPGEDDKALYAKDIAIDEVFIDLYDIEVLYGRSFSKDFKDDESVVLSLSAAEQLLGKEDLASWIDKTVYYETAPYKLIGIVEDISQESLKEEVQPHIYTYHDRVIYYSIKLKPENMQATINEVQTVFSQVFPESHFDYFFLDEYFNRQYKADKLFGRIFSFFSLLAIVITSLGLFGLSLYNIGQRSKEVSIRKILGVKVGSLFYLLTKEYFLMLFGAALVAIPLGYYLIENWLAGFANRITVSVGLFFLPMLIVLALTLITVAYQVLKAAFANPAETLRYE